ncbi:MAG TPA: MAPEG family protein [Gammaproteobacteria bacterium]|nr:MAPEG family protein [Gammaproteobacteria bacterium]
MNTEMQMLLFATVLGLVQLLLAATFNVQKYGLSWALGNRDKIMPPLEGLGGRTVRAFHNFRETFPLFAALVLLVAAMGHHDSLTLWGAQLYFWARLVYLFVYMAGIIYLRTLVWAVSLVGLVMLLIALF